MKRVLHKKNVHLLLAALLLGHSFETVSVHHEHEDHSCVFSNGSFFYMEPLAGAETKAAPETPRLRGILLGDSHQHDDCALCHLIPSFYPPSAQEKPVAGVVAMACPGDWGRESGRLLSTHFSRGPPTNS